MVGVSTNEPFPNEEHLEGLVGWLGEDQTLTDEEEIAAVHAVLAEYQVSETAQKIVSSVENDEYNVALQFPDKMLLHAPLVCEGLRLCTEQLLQKDNLHHSKNVFYFILGDTSYGECCIDEVASQHLSANLIVHYGNACLSPSRTIPVLYIFPRYEVKDAQLCCENIKNIVSNAISKTSSDRIVLLYDLDLTAYFHKDRFEVNDKRFRFDEIETTKNIAIANVRIRNSDQILEPKSQNWECAKDETAVGVLSFQNDTIPLNKTTFLWITTASQDENWSPAIRNAALQLSTGSKQSCCDFLCASIDKESNSDAAFVNATRILQKRYAQIEKTKSAERIGIIAGTLGISGNTDIIERCKRVIKAAGKRCYMMLVGKINPAKLANFPEIDVFVLVACPQNSILNGRDYLQPIITPLELEAALLRDGDIFTDIYSADFRTLLSRQLDDFETDKSNDGIEENDQNSTVAERGDWSVSVSGNGAAADFLKLRSWQGLKYDEGGTDDNTAVADLPVEIMPGQSGIASGYEREKKEDLTESLQKRKQDSVIKNMPVKDHDLPKRDTLKARKNSKNNT